jgi:hypothetical protein
MIPKRNPASLAAGRAPNSFCLEVEHSEDSLPPLSNRASIVGIDIGAKGAIVRLSPSGELIDICEMPRLHDGPAGRRNVNAPLLAEIVAKSHASRATLSSLAPRPGEGAVGAFAFERSKGVREVALGALGIPATHTASASWERLWAFVRAVKGRRTPRARKRFTAGLASRLRSPANATMGKAEAGQMCVGGGLRGGLR